MPSNDLSSASLDLPQSAVMPKPNTIASATTVAPTHIITFITGTTNIATITPPEDGAHALYFIFTTTTPGQLLTTGNILVGSTTVISNRPVLLLYDPNAAKYYPANHAA